MRTTTKILGATAAVLALTALGAYAVAQPGPPMGMGMGHGMMGQGRGPMMGNFGNPAERLASAKAEIGIKPEQTAAWDAYAKVVTETAAEQRGHRENIDPDAIRSMQPSDRQQRFDTMRKQQDAAATKVKAAAETLVAQLEDTQKAQASRTLPGLFVAPRQGMRQGMMGGGGMGPGSHR